MIFKLVYDAPPRDVAQIGVLNAGSPRAVRWADPVQWLTVADSGTTFFLMIVL